MPDTKSYPITFKGSVTPAATKFLKSDPIVMDFSGAIDLDATDASLLTNVQKAFQSEMAARLKTAVGHLNTWLAEKDKVIDGMVKRFEALKNEGFPATPAAANQRAATLKELGILGAQIQLFPNEYKQIVADWAENAREQQARVCMVTAIKKARVKTISEKTWRVRAGQAVKVLLVVAVIALSIAAIVVTAGSTAPIFIALAGAGLAISGISSIAQLGKMFVANATIEKKLMANLAKDIETVRAALNPLANTKSSIAKHVTELRIRMKTREDDIRTCKTEIQKQDAAVKGYIAALDKLKNDKSVLPADLAKRQKAIDAMNVKLKAVGENITKLEKSNTAGQKILDELEALNVQLDKISGQSANSLAGNLKETYTSLDGWIDLGNNVGGLVGAASGVQA